MPASSFLNYAFERALSARNWNEGQLRMIEAFRGGSVRFSVRGYALLGEEYDVMGVDARAVRDELRAKGIRFDIFYVEGELYMAVTANPPTFEFQVDRVSEAISTIRWTLATTPIQRLTSSLGRLQVAMYNFG